MNITNIKFDTKIEQFLQQSNYIENERSEQAFTDAKLAWMIAHTSRDKIDVKYILNIHKALMKSLRKDIAGKLRTCDVWIGGQLKRFISKELIYGQLNGWLKYYKKLQQGNENLCEKAHIDFENIHPFEDGNGRVGRILYNIHRLNCNLPIHIIHEGEEQMKYYQWFKK